MQPESWHDGLLLTPLQIEAPIDRDAKVRALPKPAKIAAVVAEVFGCADLVPYRGLEMDASST